MKIKIFLFVIFLCGACFAEEIKINLPEKPDFKEIFLKRHPVPVAFQQETIDKYIYRPLYGTDDDWIKDWAKEQYLNAYNEATKTHLPILIDMPGARANNPGIILQSKGFRIRLLEGNESGEGRAASFYDINHNQVELCEKDFGLEVQSYGVLTGEVKGCATFINGKERVLIGGKRYAIEITTQSLPDETALAPIGEGNFKLSGFIRLEPICKERAEPNSLFVEGNNLIFYDGEVFHNLTDMNSVGNMNLNVTPTK